MTDSATEPEAKAATLATILGQFRDDARHNRDLGDRTTGVRMSQSIATDNDYTDFLTRTLSIPRLTRRNPLAVDLFAGCGGLALGFEAGGFRTIGYELDSDACSTYRRNLHGECRHCELRPGFDYDLAESPALVIGGPPCQPFSVIGHQSGPRDSRDGFPAFLDAVERLRPRAAMFENVRGMLYKNRGYLERIVDELSTLGYIVESPRVLNAGHFGVPQRRERLIVIAHRSRWEWPKALVSKPFTAGQALGKMAYEAPPGSKFLTASMDKYVASYEAKSKCTRPRDLHLNEPARTVTCRNLNGATSDMMRIRLSDGRRRRITVREGARLQGFPDWFEFDGAEGSQFNQVGNAVPPPLAKALAASMRDLLSLPELTDAEVRTVKRKREEQLCFESMGAE